MDSARGVQTSLWTGCPIRILRAPRSYAAPPERFAGLRVLHRPSAPRHPPRTLSCLCVPSLDPLEEGTCVAERCFSLPFTCGDSSCARTDSVSQRTRPLAFLCFSLLALGKIEVIVNVILNLHRSCKCASQEALTTEKWKPASPLLRLN